MSKKKLLSIILIVFIATCFLFILTFFRQTDKEEKVVQSNVNTLHVGFSYWWSGSGPFPGLCAKKYALAFVGEVSDISPPTPFKEGLQLYTPQDGVIEILEILSQEKLEKQAYTNQKYFQSYCFNRLPDIKKGDTVIVFCHDYYGRYTLTGRIPIVKITGKNDPVLLSIKKYIKNAYNPLVIKDDIALWEEKGLGDDLRQIIECKEFSLEAKNNPNFEL